MKEDPAKKGTPVNPAGRETAPEQQQQKQQDNEGEFRNAETAAGSASSYGDTYESKQEDEIAREEARTENENRPNRAEK